jgi:hypothetical protein
MSTLYAAGVSQSTPLSGQKHRSGNNFDIDRAPSGTKTVTMQITGNVNVNTIIFDVMEDKSMASDPTIVKGAKNGTSFPYKGYTDLYLANPLNSGGLPFVVEFFFS